MQNISNDDLDTVTGGTTGAITGGTLPPPHSITSAGSTGTGSGLPSGLLTSLNSISDSIKGLSNNNNNNGLNSNTMLMFGMALAMRNRSDSNVYVNYGGGGGCHGGFSWHARW
ncbi:MAG TPA: hypothetical protein VFQ65_18950 [Kofleriaceae bacterium]|nr:hypothetical protein [Kofleriaceae bacterium]